MYELSLILILGKESESESCHTTQVHVRYSDSR